MTSSSCSDTADSCTYTYGSNSATDNTVKCAGSGSSLSTSCPAVDTTQLTIYDDIHTTLRYTGSCESDFAAYTECEGEVYFGAEYTNNSSIHKVGLFLLAALMMLF